MTPTGASGSAASLDLDDGVQVNYNKVQTDQTAKCWMSWPNKAGKGEGELMLWQK